MSVIEELRSVYNDAIPRLVEFVKTRADNFGSPLRLENYACSFAPYVGSNYENAVVRIAIVGKATYGWGGLGCEDLAKFTLTEEFWNWSSVFVSRDVTPFYAGDRSRKYYNSLFWQRTYLLVSAILEGLDRLEDAKSTERAQRCFNSLAWTNVFFEEPESDLCEVSLSEQQAFGFRTPHFQNRGFDPQALLKRVRSRLN